MKQAMPKEGELPAVKLRRIGGRQVQALKWAACPLAVSARWLAARAGGWRRLVRDGVFGALPA
jgi:hypothetical protein